MEPGAERVDGRAGGDRQRRPPSADMVSDHGDQAGGDMRVGDSLPGQEADLPVGLCLAGALAFPAPTAFPGASSFAGHGK